MTALTPRRERHRWTRLDRIIVGVFCGVTLAFTISCVGYWLVEGTLFGFGDGGFDISINNQSDQQLEIQLAGWKEPLNSRPRTVIQPWQIFITSGLIGGTVARSEKTKGGLEIRAWDETGSIIYCRKLNWQEIDDLWKARQSVVIEFGEIAC